jgi:hypothetical protein
MIGWKFGNESGQKRARGKMLREVFTKTDRGGNRESAGRAMGSEGPAPREPVSQAARTQATGAGGAAGRSHRAPGAALICSRRRFFF